MFADKVTLDDTAVAGIATYEDTIDDQVALVPSDFKYCSFADVCTGSNALRALVADVCPVPPSVKGSGVPRSSPDLTLKSLSANLVHVSPSYIYYIISVLN